LINSETVGKVQRMSPIPPQRENMIGLFRERMIAGRITVTTYDRADRWRLSRKSRVFKQHSFD
jgi:hypothetical protein